jgi:DNA invertase Pin-like site-specific DNA recombinase
MLGGRAKFERERISIRSFKGSERAKARGVKRKAKLTDHQKRREHGEETLAEIARSHNVSGWVSGWTISRLRDLYGTEIATYLASCWKSKQAQTKPR